MDVVQILPARRRRRRWTCSCCTRLLPISRERIGICYRCIKALKLLYGGPMALWGLSYLICNPQLVTDVFDGATALLKTAKGT